MLVKSARSVFKRTGGMSGALWLDSSSKEGVLSSVREQRTCMATVAHGQAKNFKFLLRTRTISTRVAGNLGKLELVRSSKAKQEQHGAI